MLLTLEMNGDDTSTGQRQFTIPYNIAYTKCTLHSVDVNVAGTETSDLWNKTETDDGATGPGREVYAPLYLALDGLLDPSEVMTFADSNVTPRTLVPIGTAEINTGTRGEPRVLNTVLSSSARNLRSGDVLTMQLLYRSVESGTHGAIQEFASGTFYDDNRVQVTLLLE